ncbi:hypothetical protein GOBAR_DD21536 [Gossypium barbadense]|nr:hypothetical protein GOBAR_DD21536 [Gossypium barbadense]
MYVGGNAFRNTMVVDPLSEGGDAPLQEHHIPMSPNIVKPPSISPMPTVSAEIKMSSKMSALAPRCGSSRHPPIPTSSVEVEPTVGAEIKDPSMSSALTPRLGSRRHSPIPTSSVEVEPTVSAEINEPSMSSVLAPKLGSRRHLAWSRVDLLSTSYVPETNLDSPLLAPVRSLRAIGRRRSLRRYDLEPPRTPFLPRTRLGDDISSTMRFCNRSSHTVVERSMISPVRRAPTLMFRVARTI